MAETGHDLGEQLETVPSFVRDQYAQCVMSSLVIAP
jgi:hypothetical protein